MLLRKRKKVKNIVKLKEPRILQWIMNINRCSFFTQCKNNMYGYLNNIVPKCNLCSRLFCLRLPEWEFPSSYYIHKCFVLLIFDIIKKEANLMASYLIKLHLLLFVVYFKIQAQQPLLLYYFENLILK